ncbi:LPXTG cell wall anchor domain-containing protein [Streptomyces sp. PR69]|uniref:LPXTG cell wall anchor domain-containing protein n=1 Tax=Streptomyces sp. PR69 TaxID=2984950 RepID=UPI002264FE0C|nr:LPXTG cell wall anchor domain-containing protein [Streptomyces sp. PR69]
MSAARRPLLTATAAGTLLCALCFVPSANATAEQETREAAHTAAQRQSAAASPQAQEQDLRLADTGSFDTTPYLLGGTALLAAGVGLVTYSVRRRPAPPYA